MIQSSTLIYSGWRFVLIALTLSLNANAQLEESIGASFYRGFIFAHSKDVENTAGSNPIGFQLEWNKQLLDEKTWQICNCFPRKGFLFQYFDYDNIILGKSAHLVTYIEPYWGYGRRISASLKGMSGLAFLSNPYSSIKNPTNQSYSLPLAVYVSLGLGFHARVTKKLNVNMYANYNHISNGGIKDPNKGINWPTMSIGFDYIMQSVVLPPRTKHTYDKSSALKTWEIIPFWSSRTLVAGEKKRWHIFGIAGLYTKQVAHISALTFGAEVWHDYSLQERLNRDTTNGASATRLGGLAGHVFLMGKISLSQQLGVYILNPSNYFPLLYQRYGLQFKLNRNWSIGTNVLVHGHVANFLDFRLAHVLK